MSWFAVAKLITLLADLTVWTRPTLAVMVIQIVFTILSVLTSLVPTCSGVKQPCLASSERPFASAIPIELVDVAVPLGMASAAPLSARHLVGSVVHEAPRLVPQSLISEVLQMKAVPMFVRCAAP